MALPPPSPESTALVTGASSGIGVELARALARRGHGVTLVARRMDRLEGLATELAGEHGIRAEAVACDLGDDDARAGLPAQVAALGLTVEILCNNAGYGSAGSFTKLDNASETAMVRLNCETIIALCGHYAPQMVERGRGAILNTASTVAFQPMPRQATYSASKAFALTFTEALHEELRGEGVSVTALCPGPVKTEFVEVADVGAAADMAPSFVWVPVEEVAEAGIKGLERNRRVVLPGAFNRLTAPLGHHTPRGLLLRAAGRFYPLGRD